MIGGVRDQPSLPEAAGVAERERMARLRIAAVDRESGGGLRGGKRAFTVTQRAVAACLSERVVSVGAIDVVQRDRRPRRPPAPATRGSSLDDLGSPGAKPVEVGLSRLERR